jgi:uncharacterized protein YutE (UPF0331/DUF86 family)
MVDKEKLAKYIQELEGYLIHLDELQKHPIDEFISDWRIFSLVDRQLHLTLESFLTIGEMIIAEFGFDKPDTYADIPRILFENKVISKRLNDQLIDLARFRNVLVHDYLSLDHEKVYQHIQKDPKIIREFIKEVKKFVSMK